MPFHKNKQRDVKVEYRDLSENEVHSIHKEINMKKELTKYSGVNITRGSAVPFTNTILVKAGSLDYVGADSSVTRIKVTAFEHSDQFSMLLSNAFRSRLEYFTASGKKETQIDASYIAENILVDFKELYEITGDNSIVSIVAEIRPINLVEEKIPEGTLNDYIQLVKNGVNLSDAGEEYARIPNISLGLLEKLVTKGFPIYSYSLSEPGDIQYYRKNTTLYYHIILYQVEIDANGNKQANALSESTWRKIRDYYSSTYNLDIDELLVCENPSVNATEPEHIDWFYQMTESTRISFIPRTAGSKIHSKFFENTGIEFDMNSNKYDRLFMNYLKACHKYYKQMFGVDEQLNGAKDLSGVYRSVGDLMLQCNTVMAQYIDLDFFLKTIREYYDSYKSTRFLFNEGLATRYLQGYIPMFSVNSNLHDIFHSYKTYIIDKLLLIVPDWANSDDCSDDVISRVPMVTTPIYTYPIKALTPSHVFISTVDGNDMGGILNSTKSTIPNNKQVSINYMFLKFLTGSNIVHLNLLNLYDKILN